jgi:Fic family protein
LTRRHPRTAGGGRHYGPQATRPWRRLSRVSRWSGIRSPLASTRVCRQRSQRAGRSFLLTQSDDNDLTYFLLAQVKVIQQAIASLHAYLERKTAEVCALQQRLEGMEGLNHRQLALLRHALRHSGFRYSVLTHQNSHGVNHQTARDDLRKLAGRGLLIPGKEGRQDIFRVPEDLPVRLPA